MRYNVSGGLSMYAQSTSDLTRMIMALTDEYRIAAVKYVEYLSQAQKNSAKVTLRKIQDLFSSDKGWSSEDDMLKDMANFRRKRLAKCEY